MTASDLITGKDHKLIELNKSPVVFRIEQSSYLYEKGYLDYLATAIHNVKEKLTIDPVLFKDNSVVLLKLRRIENLKDLIIHYLYDLKERKESLDFLQDNIALEIERAQEVIDNIALYPGADNAYKMLFQQGNEIFQLKRQFREAKYTFNKDVARLKEAAIEIIKEYFDELSEIESIADIKISCLSIDEIFAFLQLKKSEEILVKREPEIIKNEWEQLERIP